MSKEVDETEWSTQLDSISFANRITFDNEYLECAHKRQTITKKDEIKS